uniref:Cnidarian restricted protein n=1 Tax=Clytia hemisphaerica TaxID=252671 RepID=A0A7M5UL02_9CNID
MKTLTIICLVLALCGATLAARYPTWPQEFRWNSAGSVDGMACTRIHESADKAGTWLDNYFCHASAPGIQGVGMRWSSAGPISGMRCTYIVERAEPLRTTWLDNFLCVPSDSPFRFSWSSAGPIKGKKCIQWHESADPHTWHDNYLCM